LIKRSDCTLVVIDVQDRIIETISEYEAVVQNVKALIKAFQVLHVPVLSTEQEKLGKTVPDLAALLNKSPLIRKFSFSCYEPLELNRRLSEAQRRTAVICGIETHICVLQTVLDLLKNGYSVQVVRDAVSSHRIIDHETALDRMKMSGAVMTTTEATIYELTERAGTEEFRKILQIVKERRRFVDQGPRNPNKDVER